MPTISLTEARLAAAGVPPGRTKLELYDSGVRGFGAIVQKTGIAFVAKHRDRYGHLRTITIGRLGEPGAGDDHGLVWTLKRAREAAIKVLGSLKQGVDVQPTKAATALTVKAAIEMYLAELRKNGSRPSSVVTVEREMLTAPDPKRETQGAYVYAWLSLPIADITGRMCRDEHERITSEHGAHVANRVMRQFRAVWNHADKEIATGVIPGAPLGRSPTLAVRWNVEGGDVEGYVQRRQEPIAKDQMPAWRKAVDKLSPVRRDYQLFCLLTGIRRNDAATVRWEHCNLVDEPGTARVWNPSKQAHEAVKLPARSLVRPMPKGGKGRAFIVPLVVPLVEILKARKEANGALGRDDGGWVFPSEALKDRDCPLCKDLGRPAHEKGKITHLAEPKEPKKKRVANAALVSPHRLRDTYTTALAALDPQVSPYVIDVLTNHRPPRGTVTAGYIALDPEALREPQERVATALLALCATIQAETSDHE